MASKVLYGIRYERNPEGVWVSDGGRFTIERSGDGNYRRYILMDTERYTARGSHPENDWCQTIDDAAEIASRRAVESEGEWGGYATVEAAKAAKETRIRLEAEANAESQRLWQIKIAALHAFLADARVEEALLVHGLTLSDMAHLHPDQVMEPASAEAGAA